MVRATIRATAISTWQALIDAADDREHARLVQLADHLFHHAEQITHQALAAGAWSTPLTEMAHALLAGRPAETLAAQAGVHLAGAYAVVVLETGASAATSVTTEHPTAVIDRRRHLLIPIDPGVTAHRLREVGRTLTQATPEAGRVSAVLAASAAAVPAAAEAAVSVSRVVSALNRPAGTYLVHDVALELSLLRSPDLATLLATRVEPLDTAATPLLETLRVYVDHDQDRRRTARTLRIHPNTLDYRLRRIGELTDLSPTSPRDVQLLCTSLTALQICRIIGG